MHSEEEGCHRDELYRGMTVDIVLKKDQKTGVLTRGKILNILTSNSYHSRGIKVMLFPDENGDELVGRVVHTNPTD